jgi:hypothetical protein
MYFLLPPSLLQAVLAVTSIAYGRPNHAPGVHVDNNDQDHIKVQHILDSENVGYMPISHGKCYYLSKSGYGRVAGDPTYNALQFRTAVDKKRVFRLCKSRTSCVDESRDQYNQRVKNGAAFFVWSYDAWPGAPERTNPDYLATDGVNWFFPSNDGWGNEYVRFKGHYSPDDDDDDADDADTIWSQSPSYSIRLSVASTLGSRTNPTYTGLYINPNKIIMRCSPSTSPYLTLKFHETDCPSPDDDNDSVTGNDL